MSNDTSLAKSFLDYIPIPGVSSLSPLRWRSALLTTHGTSTAAQILKSRRGRNFMMLFCGKWWGDGVWGVCRGCVCRGVCIIKKLLPFRIANAKPKTDISLRPPAPSHASLPLRALQTCRLGRSRQADGLAPLHPRGYPEAAAAALALLKPGTKVLGLGEQLTATTPHQNAMHALHSGRVFPPRPTYSQPAQVSHTAARREREAQGLLVIPRTCEGAWCPRRRVAPRHAPRAVE